MFFGVCLSVNLSVNVFLALLETPREGLEGIPESDLLLGKRVCWAVRNETSFGGVEFKFEFRFELELFFCTMDMVSKANFILSTRLEYVVDVKVLEDVIYVDMKSSTSSRINKSIRRFMVSDDGVAVFALRKNTSTNLLVLGVLKGDDVTFIPDSCTIESRNGKFYRELTQFRVRLTKNSGFNLDISSSSEFLANVERGTGVGVVCPKMASGQMPYVRGLISLLGVAGCHLSKNGRYSLRHSGCFVKIQ